MKRINMEGTKMKWEECAEDEVMETSNFKPFIYIILSLIGVGILIQVVTILL